ncbi:MAG: DUF4232 domain-containing protein [Solirubrobacteraceae bacterium]
MRTRNRLLALAATLATFTATAAGLAVTAPAGAALPSCQTAGLDIWFGNHLNGTAGTFFYDLRFTNLSGRSCTLRGYPGVSAVNLRGGKVGGAATRLSGHPITTVTLAPLATATATVGLVDVGAIGPKACRPVTAAGFRVFPPNQRASRLVPFPFAACSKGSSLRIMPVTK